MGRNQPGLRFLTLQSRPFDSELVYRRKKKKEAWASPSLGACTTGKPRAKKVKPVPQQTLQAPEEPKATEAPKEELPAIDTDDPFLQKLLSFFQTSNITVLEQIAIKKKSEYDFVVQLESPVGKLHYYCKAKSKAKVGESDLSHAFVQGQLKKLPILFLTPGSLTKPAQELIKQLKGLTVKQV